jgi:hypothetical protein
MMTNDAAGDDVGTSLDRVTREVEYGPRGKRRPRHRKFSHWIKGDADASLFVGDGIIRNYQVIDGKLVFLCYGRAITIRERPLNIVVLMLMFTAAGLYLGFMYVCYLISLEDILRCQWLFGQNCTTIFLATNLQRSLDMAPRLTGCSDNLCL